MFISNVKLWIINESNGTINFPFGFGMLHFIVHALCCRHQCDTQRWIYEYKKNRVNSQWNRKWPIEMHDTQSETKKSMLQNQSPRANNSQAIEWASMNNWIQAKCKRNTFDCPFILFTV